MREDIPIKKRPCQPRPVAPEGSSKGKTWPEQRPGPQQKVEAETPPDEGRTTASPIDGRYLRRWSEDTQVISTPVGPNGQDSVVTASPGCTQPRSPGAQSTDCDTPSATLTEPTPNQEDTTQPDQPAFTTEASVSLIEQGGQEAPLCEHMKELSRLEHGPVNDEAWQQVINTLEDAITVAQKTAKIKTDDNSKGPRKSINPENAKEIQGLYRRNRRLAVRLILEGPPTPCPIPKQELEEYSDVWAERNANTALLTTWLPAPENVDLPKLLDQ